MNKKRGFLDWLIKLFDLLHIIVGLVAGSIGAYVLGHFFGMGTQGYVIGFILGVAIAFGAISF